MVREQTIPLPRCVEGSYQRQPKRQHLAAREDSGANGSLPAACFNQLDIKNYMNTNMEYRYESIWVNLSYLILCFLPGPNFHSLCLRRTQESTFVEEFEHRRDGTASCGCGFLVAGSPCDLHHKDVLKVAFDYWSNGSDRMIVDVEHMW